MFKYLHRKLCEQIYHTNMNDNRCCRLVAVIECIFNQNARDAGAATFPATNRPILNLCNAYDVGIIQMPCPEIGFLGFNRKRQLGQSIRDALDTKEGRYFCRKISIDIVDRIENYNILIGCLEFFPIVIEKIDAYPIHRFWTLNLILLAVILHSVST